MNATNWTIQDCLLRAAVEANAAAARADLRPSQEAAREARIAAAALEQVTRLAEKETP